MVELYREYLKRWSRLLKYDSKFFLVHKHINMYGYGHQHYFTPLVLACGTQKCSIMLALCSNGCIMLDSAKA